MLAILGGVGCFASLSASSSRRERYATQGQALGITAEEMAARYPLRVQRADALPRGEVVLEQPGTAAFQRWFGDSKVVDADGKPLVVYHGTNADFNEHGQRKTWLLTGWGEGKPDVPKQVRTDSGTTQRTPTFGRDALGAGLERSLSADSNTLNKDGDAGPRAQIAFGRDITQQPSVITLLPGADFSSFTHELGHFDQVRYTRLMRAIAWPRLRPWTMPATQLLDTPKRSDRR